MPLSQRALCVVLGILAQAAGAETPPDAFEGLWSATPEACDPTAEDGGAIRVEAGVLHGAGSSCRMTRPVDVRDMDAVLYDMVCEGADAEGAPGTWTDRAMMLHAADGGLVLVWNGFAFKYAPCTGPQAAEASP